LEHKSNTTSFFDLLIILAKHKIFILKTVIGISILALVISLLWPQKYHSSSEIVQTRESIGSFGGLLQNIGSIGTSQSKVGGETMLIILNSQGLKDELIEEFNLAEVYGTNIKEALYQTLNGVIEIEEVREGGFGFNPIVSVKIGVIDKEPKRAQEMNQFILAELQNRMEEINLEGSQENLQIIEQRFQQNEINLRKAEMALNAFQKEYGILEISSQLGALISNLGQLKSTIIQEEIELEVMEDRLEKNSNQIAQKKQEILALQRAYENMIQESENLAKDNDAFYSLFDMPDLMLRYTRLFREVEIQNTIYEFLVPQLEQQRLYVANNSSGIRVIDSPDLPTYKHSPKRAFIVLGGFFFAVFLSLFVVFLRELRENGDSEYNQKMDRLKEELRFTSFSKSNN
tara:strand:+ start:35771 stop:36976 length:1206 start_codon:yes stop_codon:yes gene_type:complete